MTARKSLKDGMLPATVVASRAVARQESYSGRIPLEKLVRLRPLLEDAGGELQVEIEISRDGEGAGWIKGRVTGALQLICQRGLHPYAWPCDLALSLRLVDSESEEEQVLEHQDPYLVHDDSLPLLDLVEDEVLLSMPMLPRCEDPGCVDRL